MRRINNILFFLIFTLTGKVSFSQSPQLLIARNLGEKVLSNNDTIRVFGFATSLSAQPNVPGPTIYGNEGDSVIIDLFNVSQGAPHTIHLHGLDVNQQNDGVGHLSFEVNHMDHGFYRFKAPHPGTYLYHCHVTSPIHVQAGMYGLVIIKPASGADSTWTGGYAYNKDVSFLMSEIDTVWHRDSVLDHDHDTSQMIMYTEVPFYAPQFFLVNGLSDQQLNDSIVLNTSVGEVNYIRLSNLGFYYNRVIFPAGLNCQMIDSDGRPLPQVQFTDTAIVFPGERYGMLAEAQSQFSDSVIIEYVDMNTDEVMGSQYVLVNVNGFFNLPEVEPVENRIKLYPNPGKDNLFLNYVANGEKILKVEISDMKGTLLISHTVNSVSAEVISFDIPVSSLSPGIYSVILTDEKGNTGMKKWVKVD